jgi:hypothetical protein
MIELSLQGIKVHPTQRARGTRRHKRETCLDRLVAILKARGLM